MTEKEKDVKLDDVQIVRANEFLGTNPLAPYGQVEAVRAMSRRIRALDKADVPLNTGESMHLAQLAISHDLNPFSGEVWGWVQLKNNKRHFSWMPGRRGLIRHANEQAKAEDSKWWDEYRTLTEHEKSEMGIPRDALAEECRVFETATMDPWRKTFDGLIAAGVKADEALRLAGKPPCSVGVGVMTQQEISRMPKNNKMPHINRCRKRALMEALKGKYSLHFGGAKAGPGGETFEDYVVDSKGAIDVEFEDVEEPYGMEPEAFGGKDRLDPKFWKGSCEKMVEEELARDPFVAAELLAYSLFIPGNAKGKHLTGFFQIAKDILIEQLEEDPEGKVNFKKIAEDAYGQLFEPKKKEKTKNEPKAKPVQKKPKGKAKAKKPVAPKAKKKSPAKKDTKPIKTDLTKKEANALVRMAEDYPAICPTDRQDWNTAYKYIDLKESGTNRKEFVKLVNDECKADVRLGMALKLGYL